MKKKVDREDLTMVIIDPGDQSLHGAEKIPIHKWYMIHEYCYFCTVCGVEIVEVKMIEQE